MKYKCWVFSWMVFWSRLQAILSDPSTDDTNHFTQSPTNENQRGIFSPRMDYEQWKPLGRSDPLKNDPTYDYVPPVLDRVHYWMDPSLRKPDPTLPTDQSQKTEILVLGVSSKKPSTGASPPIADSRKDAYDSFLKFVDAPKFNPHQRLSRPHYPHFAPPFAKSKPAFSKSAPEQRTPYTMLMPPPLATKTPSTSSASKPATLQQITTGALRTTTPSSSTTQSRVTVQAANLVYQASSLGHPNDWRSTPEASTRPNLSTKKAKPLYQTHLAPPESYIQIQFAPRENFTNKPLVAANSDHNINYVTPPPLIEEIMHKGQVSDDNLDISNTYVKIGKPEAQMHSTGLDNMPAVLPAEMLVRQPPNLMVFSHVQHPMRPEAMQSTQIAPIVQTVAPPTITTNAGLRLTSNPLIRVLEKERSDKPSTESSTARIASMTMASSTTSTTTTALLTTDPLFKHYKQPVEPLKGPLYLIIQGHSKVKTYGPTKQYHGIRVQETNEIADEEVAHVKHLHGFNKRDENNAEVERNGARRGRSGNLQTLKHVIETGLGAIDFGEFDIGNRRRDDFREAELQFGYQVGDDVTSEKYRKGIVEEARKLRIEA